MHAVDWSGFNPKDLYMGTKNKPPPSPNPLYKPPNKLPLIIWLILDYTGIDLVWSSLNNIESLYSHTLRLFRFHDANAKMVANINNSINQYKSEQARIPIIEWNFSEPLISCKNINTQSKSASLLKIIIF